MYFFVDPNFKVNPGPLKDGPLGLAGWMAGWMAGSQKSLFATLKIQIKKTNTCPGFWRPCFFCVLGYRIQTWCCHYIIIGFSSETYSFGALAGQA